MGCHRTAHVSIPIVKLASCKTYLWNKDLVALLDTHCDSLAFSVESTWSNGQNLSFIELLYTALGQEDATSSLGLGLDSLDKNAVEEWDESADALEGGRLGSVSGAFLAQCAE